MATSDSSSPENRNRVDAKDLLECLGDRAGMQGCDMNKIKDIVFEASVGSKFYENEQKKAKQLEDSIEAVLKKRKFYLESTTKSFRDEQKRKSQTIVKSLLSVFQVLPSDVWIGPCYCHIDMDMFYCAVEQLEQPALKLVPVAVGGSGMICTANYEARKFGVRAGMPGFIGLQLCPALRLIRPRFQKYAEKSEDFKKIVAQYDPTFLSKSCDEVSMDLKSLVEGKSLEDIQTLVQEIRLNVYRNTGGLTCSAGVAPTRPLAKVFSNENKPNGQFALFPWECLDRLRGLPCRKIPGIGKTRATTFEAMNIKVLGDLWNDADIILYIYPEITARNLLSISTGHHVEIDRNRKSSGCERSFQATRDENFLYNMLGSISDRLHDELERLNCVAPKVVLKVKDENFNVRTLTGDLPVLTNRADLVSKTASALFRSYWHKHASNLDFKIRSLGITATPLKIKGQNSSVCSIEEFIKKTKCGESACNSTQVSLANSPCSSHDIYQKTSHLNENSQNTAHPNDNSQDTPHFNANFHNTPHFSENSQNTSRINGQSQTTPHLGENSRNTPRINGSSQNISYLNDTFHLHEKSQDISHLDDCSQSVSHSDGNFQLHPSLDPKSLHFESPSVDIPEIQQASPVTTQSAVRKQKQEQESITQGTLDIFLCQKKSQRFNSGPSRPRKQRKIAKKFATIRDFLAPKFSEKEIIEIDDT